MNAPSRIATRRRAIDDLDRAIVNLSARINACTYELLVLVREFDERAGFLQWGLASCAEWLHWRCDLSLSAAREKVRAAHALKCLPQISEAFARGTLSYSKVRALTGVATAENEPALLAFALPATATRVEERCRQMRNVHPASTKEADRLHRQRALRVFPDEDRGTLTFAVELPLELGELLCRALDDAHHVRHWSHGGETNLDNLLLLCSSHHRLVHEGGYEIVKDYQRKWYFRRPDGRAIPEHGYRPEDVMDEANPSAEGWETHRGAEIVSALPP